MSFKLVSFKNKFVFCCGVTLFAFIRDCALRRNFFYGKQNGSFLELGGYNGCTFSNSLMLEAGAGWTVRPLETKDGRKQL